MSVSLYRKYRPARFEDIIGQDHVARTLVNAIKHDRVSHAYLFAGPRGTGKTSTAKILAMALNCDAGEGKATPTPDGTCPHCEAIRRGSAMDVVEMDAASNRGIDDIRDLRDKVHFSPVEGRMKVYIVDEVHMLTPEAFNALLKTLEEPPVHAVFVLATTEPHKVPATILSRCQRFDFRRPSISEVVSVLKGVAAQEGIEVAEISLTVIARAAGGSFRDAIGILDQLATYSGGKISLEETLDILGIVQHDLLFELVDLAQEHDTRGALLFVERLNQGGTDYAQFIKDLLGHLRDLYVIKHTADMPPSIAATEEQLDRLRSQAARVSTILAVTFIDLLGEALRSIRQGSDPRLELELVLIKMTALGAGGIPQHAPEPATSEAPAPTGTRTPTATAAPQAPAATAAPQAPATKPALVQKKLVTAAETLAVSAPEAEAPAGPPPPAEAEQPASSATVRPDIDHLKRAWPLVLEAVKKRQAGLSAVLGEGQPESLEGDELVIKFPAGYSFQANQVARNDNPRVITEALRDITGKELRITTRLANEPIPPPADGEEDARILSKDDLIRALEREFGARVMDDGPTL
ncbi:MAG: DNA polymerase III, subunit gamma and tau [Actinobacteria bacterium RBG_16_64_13]|nr:MAG: DNA polymerase III, subunit gamma and tau [Actinobacteria bacterium RBG_16_64_13]